ncbi:glutamate--cysteine ligase [Halogeometricum pallidum JCM 14848]|uniref:Glutamate--cysteine ligase n=1 Tax=Halogeometricum pallidum JCM 14848 TaxID=1227487 RepID=M0CVC2_HALPD|nr:glutamate--cysteine ligase [Halogeometricum pallidum JCM 14848]
MSSTTDHRSGPHGTAVSVDGSGPLRRSIEVEYWVVDEEGRLVEPGGLVGTTEGAEREFVEPILEVKTTPCETTAELRGELYERLETVLRRADELGKGLVPLATPMSEEVIGELDGERTRIQNRVVGDDFRYVRHCAGTHIHVEQRPGREIDQLNALVAADPALALANTSPYFDGRRLAAGARSKLYRRMAYDDVPHQGGLWRYADDTREWSRRLERRFEEFVTAAVNAGVDRTAVESNFDPESAVWTPVQLRECFSTVEWRSPDNALPSEVLRLADDVAGFVERLDGAELRIEGETGRATEETVVLPEFDAVLRYVDAAIEEGLESEDVRSYLDRMGFDVDAYSPVTHDIDGRESISPEEARELRLEHAERLERDVRGAERRSAREAPSLRERTD